MVREITTHKVNGCNEGLTVRVMDEPGSGGANHLYLVSGFRRHIPGEADPQVGMDLPFQNGPIAEVGTNGITHEALLAVVIDRLQSFQKGAYACRENALALTKLEEAMHWLHHRTRERVSRGVEGTHAR